MVLCHIVEHFAFCHVRQWLCPSVGCHNSSQQNWTKVPATRTKVLVSTRHCLVWAVTGARLGLSLVPGLLLLASPIWRQLGRALLLWAVSPLLPATPPLSVSPYSPGEVCTRLSQDDSRSLCAARRHSVGPSCPWPPQLQQGWGSEWQLWQPGVYRLSQARHFFAQNQDNSSYLRCMATQPQH